MLVKQTQFRLWTYTYELKKCYTEWIAMLIKFGVQKKKKKKKVTSDGKKKFNRFDREMLQT